MTIVAILTVRKSAKDKFIEYERNAARIMARYGGRIERSVTIPGADEVYREVHIVTFPDADGLNRYQADPELETLAADRAEAVVHTDLLVGEDEPLY